MEYPEAPSRSPSPAHAKNSTPDANNNNNNNNNNPAGDPDPDTNATEDVPDQEEDRPPSPDLPLTMTASAVLTSLPRDASAALRDADADADADRKVLVRFKAVGGGAPQLRREVRRVGAAQRFEAVVAHLRRALRLAAGDGLFLYVNSAFAPALDEVVGNLHRLLDDMPSCFKDSNDQLIVAYSITPAFG
ncbi:Ubiquitin-like protein [Diatrype stigma]|uniref:Ubiquitin-like protein ATG12 n=1 Tax=Diatrype stigma TaxID=117547 RepID=A0AAN9UQL6_9PEZI